MTVRIINHSTIGCRWPTVVKGVSDRSCNEYDFADAGLRLASANAQGNVPSLDFTISVIQYMIKESLLKCRAFYKGFLIL